MALKVLPGEFEDMETFDRIERESYSTSPLDGLLFKKAEDGSELYKAQAERNVRQWREDPAMRYFKAVDTATQQIVAFAQYKIFHGDTLKLISYPTVQDIPSRFGDSANYEPASDFFRNLWAARERVVGYRPNILLQKLNTDPRHQRRGAGSMLVQLGCDLADDLGIVAGLEASPDGLPLYKKYGYIEKEAVVFDPKKYGRDAGLHKTIAMIREPVPKQ